MNLIEIANKIIAEGPICDNCLGRQFAKLGTGLTNKERGASLKIVLSMINDACNIPKSEIINPQSKCWVCNGLFENLKVWADKVIKALEDYEYNTFLIGTKMTGLLSENEEIIVAESGTTYSEPLKSELNREVGKLVQEVTKKEVDFKKPDIVALLDLENNTVELQVSSLYIYGRYKKLARGIPQTRWHCRYCRGEGCEECNFTGKLYKESVDELIREPVILACKCIDTVFHGAGREDVDALMLGSGRPFIIEVKSPKIRNIDLDKLKDDINNYAKNKIKVSEFSYVEKDQVKFIKSLKTDKVYRVKVSFSSAKIVEEDKLKDSLDKLCGTINQQTPSRVLHRHSDKIRKKKVYSASLEKIENNNAIIIINCESGLYVKELIDSDNGRTTPSLSELIGIPAKVIELDVMKA
ncbi:MAG: tRNA pseudouridine(54/55) synthase Pus10 [Methanosarcinales archaeon]